MKFALTLCLMLVLPWAAPAADLIDRIAAETRYYGVGWQDDGSHWSIEVMITDKGAQVAYPSAACSGVWTLVSTTPRKITYTEHITDGVDNCIALGTVTLEPMADGKLLYSFQERPNIIEARAALLPLSAGRRDYMEALKATLDGVEFDYLRPEYFE